MKNLSHIERTIILFLFLFNVGLIIDINAQNGWEQMPDMPTSRTYLGSVMHNGKIYVIGGGESRNAPWLRCNEVYDIETEGWSVMASMESARASHTVEILNNKIYVIGGIWSYNQQYSNILEYDIESDTWITKCNMPEPRFAHFSEVIDGKIFISGGLTIDDNGHHPGLLSSLLYDPINDHWDTLASLNQERLLGRSCIFENKIYVFGGANSGDPYPIAHTSIEVYDPETDVWTISDDEIPVPFMGGIVLVHGDSIILFGGSKRVVTADRFYNSVYKYVPGSSEDKWAVMASMPVERYIMSGNKVDNYLYMFGGIVGIYGPDITTDDLIIAPDNHWRFNLDSLKSWEGPCSDVTMSDSEPLLGIDSTKLISLQVLPSHLPVKSVSWSSSNEEVTAVSSEGMLTGVSPGEATITATTVSGGCSESSIITVVDHIPEFILQVTDSYTSEILSNCKIYLNGKLFLKESEDGLNLTGFAYDACEIKIIRSNYIDFDTTVVVRSDTTLAIGIQYAYQPELIIYNGPLLEKTDLLKLMMNQHGWIYITPETTPAVVDSITNDAIKSKNVSAGGADVILLMDIPPGTYRIFGVSLAGRITTRSHVVQIIDHFPSCIVQVKDAYSKELINSCLLVVDKDSIPGGSQGEFDLTGLVYNTCTLEVTREGYVDFDTTLVVLSDTSYEIYLVPMNTEGLAESTNQDVRIFPNPTHDLINVQTSMQGIYPLEIINTSGQVMKRMDFSESPVQVDLSSYQSSVYLIRIIFREEVYVWRVVKY